MIMHEEMVRLEAFNEDVDSLLKQQFRGGLVSTSCVEWETNVRFLKLPQDVTSLRILDVGAGGSDLTAKFLADGADAYAVDTLYGAPQAFKVAVDASMEGWKYSRVILSRRQAALRAFQESRSLSTERYKAASAVALPFEDNSFDIVLSLKSILPYCAYDLEILAKVVNELIRVTKLGGSIQLVSYEGDGAPGTLPRYRREYRDHFRNERRLLEAIGQNPNLPYNITPIEVGPSQFDNRLEIINAP